jgi:hypothetical protein
MIIIDTPHGMTYATLAAEKMRVSVESKGMKCRGGSARLRMAKYLGMKKNATHEEVIARIKFEMELMLEDATNATRMEITPEQARAVRQMVEQYGPKWKARIQDMWTTGRNITPEMAQLRDNKGMKFLEQLQIEFSPVKEDSNV